MEIKVRNVHQALPAALNELGMFGVPRESRNGPVLKFPEPFTTHYTRPNERVIFWAERDANPFFHLFESLWMLGGRNDVGYLQQFVKTFGQYSDDGETLHGAYGYRWREAFGFDQLAVIAERLRLDKDDRRQVIQMYDAELDGKEQLGKRDIPCNLTIPVWVNEEGALCIQVVNRSNDLVWGCYGANAVHFSVLLEYLAAWIGVPVGSYYQSSTNLHAYLNTLEPLRMLPCTAIGGPWPYAGDDGVKPFPLVKSIDAFNSELPVFLDSGYNVMGYTEPFFRKVALPMLRAHAAYSDRGAKPNDRFNIALKELESMPGDNDWRLAAREWLARRRLSIERRANEENPA